MTEHASPGEDRPRAWYEDPSRLTRRVMLRRAGGGAAALGGAWLLAACGSSSSSSGSKSSASSSSSTASAADMPVASKGNPITLPISSDNKPIPSGRSPEKGPLVIYDWADYLSPAVVKSFEQRYGVSAQVTNYASIDEAINKINSGAVAADVFVPVAERMLQLVQAKLIQPINHSYVPNLDSVIPAAGDPWYDKGARYSTPNFINLFGVQWRNDLIKIDPGSLSNPWDVYWKVPKGTTIGMNNAAAEYALSMAMLHVGAKNLDTISTSQVNDAQAALKELSIKWQYTAFQPLATGVEKLSWGYNGDMVQVPHYLPKGTPLSAVSFYFPANGYGLILNDMWVIPRKAKNPVLAHLFMNHFLEEQSALDNFRDEGYQTMLKGLTIGKLKAAKVAPDHAIQMAFATAEQQAKGLPTPIYKSEQLLALERAFTALTA
ncbi:MAG TPA: extracellular solute-binding protein [Solirubrobacteraceae bacterium]|nr:extracellular solute-binding protein [Solirubrobacteraceae bacterium]